jgi:hypothetical protein
MPARVVGGGRVPTRIVGGASAYPSLADPPPLTTEQKVWYLFLAGLAVGSFVLLIRSESR